MEALARLGVRSEGGDAAEMQALLIRELKKPPLIGVMSLHQEDQEELAQAFSGEEGPRPQSQTWGIPRQKP